MNDIYLRDAANSEHGPYTETQMAGRHRHEDFEPDAQFRLGTAGAWLPLRNFLVVSEPQEPLAEWKERGVHFVRVLTARDGRDCPACVALEGQDFAIDAAPGMPPTDCTCFPWCRAVYAASPRRAPPVQSLCDQTSPPPQPLSPPPDRPVPPSLAPLSPPLPVATASHRPASVPDRWLLGGFGFFAALCAVFLLSRVLASTASPPVAPPPTASTPAATPTPTPPPPTPSVDSIVSGQKIATRLLSQYPGLQHTLNVLYQPIPKPGGIETFGPGSSTPSIGFILPEEAWNALTGSEQADLQAYVANQVPWVAQHPEDYMLIARSAPSYPADIRNVRGVKRDAWWVGTALPDPDHPGYYYTGRRLVTGPDYR